MTPDKSRPIDAAELEMHARLEAGLIDAMPDDDVAKQSRIASTEPVPQRLKSLRELLKKILTPSLTVD